MILDVPVRMFLDDIYFYNSGLWEKQTAFHNLNGPHPISSRPDWNRRLASPKQEELVQQTAFRWVLQQQLSLGFHPADFGFASFHNSVGRFFKSLSLSPYRQIDRYLHTAYVRIRVCGIHPIGVVIVVNPHSLQPLPSRM